MSSISKKRNDLELQAENFLLKEIYADNPSECPLLYFKLTALDRKTDFELYKSQLKAFKALFNAKNESFKIVLWNVIRRKGEISKPYRKDFTAAEYEFLVRALDVRGNYIELANVNKPIATDRLILRPFKISDKNLFAFHFKNDGDFFTYSGYEPTAKWIKKFSNKQAPTYFTIEEKKTKEVIGFIGIDPSEQPATGWMEYYIFKDYRKKGYCKEAIKVLVNKALNGKLYLPSTETVWRYVYNRKALKLNAIRAWVSELNTPSIKTLESCGFSHEATFHKTIYKKDIGWIDKHIYYLPKGE